MNLVFPKIDVIGLDLEHHSLSGLVWVGWLVCFCLFLFLFGGGGVGSTVYALFSRLLQLEKEKREAK